MNAKEAGRLADNRARTMIRMAEIIKVFARLNAEYRTLREKLAGIERELRAGKITIEDTADGSCVMRKLEGASK